MLQCVQKLHVSTTGILGVAGLMTGVVPVWMIPWHFIWVHIPPCEIWNK